LPQNEQYRVFLLSLPELLAIVILCSPPTRTNQHAPIAPWVKLRPRPAAPQCQIASRADAREAVICLLRYIFGFAAVFQDLVNQAPFLGVFG
jgi:hypothetical protein